ncbi:hypothetical protein CTI12_AA378720 [Artemisia annua]|uniref:Uncharacterized protein n=1 Tax=Artemisia annua TaxID=35608 RepID=A0A2U1MHV2_ARTAN|nr:hypothetical protein CTI12_AA378720 [Artemisia annua]
MSSPFSRRYDRRFGVSHFRPLPERKCYGWTETREAHVFKVEAKETDVVKVYPGGKPFTHGSTARSVGMAFHIEDTTPSGMM